MCRLSRIIICLILFYIQGYCEELDTAKDAIKASDLVFIGEIADSLSTTGETLYVRVVEIVKGKRGLEGKIVNVLAPEPIPNVVITSLRQGVFFLTKQSDNLYRITSGTIGLFKQKELIINALSSMYKINWKGILFLAFSWAFILFLIIYSFSKVI